MQQNTDVTAGIWCVLTATTPYIEQHTWKHYRRVVMPFSMMEITSQRMFLATVDPRIVLGKNRLFM